MADSEKKAYNFRKKPDIIATVFVEIDDGNMRVLTDLEEDKLSDKLPSNILKINSVWRRPNFLLSHVIDMNSYSEKIINGKIQRYFDINAMILARLRTLLKSWDFCELDPELVLEHEPSIDNKKIKILSTKSLELLGEVDPPEIIHKMYGKAMDKLYPEEAKLLKNAINPNPDGEGQTTT